ncbi:MAG: hypothetical protein ACP5EP_10820 [Acidobacteriaceae bacterium]
MFQAINEILPRHSVLRCIWVPTHTGANARLTAVWIETQHHCSFAQYSPAHDFTEGDSWACAA